MNKKTLLGSVMLLVSLIGGLVHAGAKIGDNPTTSGAGFLLELESTSKGLVISRAADSTTIANPMNEILNYTGTFATDTDNLSYEIKGTKSAAGTVTPNLSAIPIGSGSLSGRTCFDIALSNDNINSCAPLTARTTLRANFTLPAIHTQTYTFTPTGAVSNIRFYYVNEVGNAVASITGGNSGNSISTVQKATANYNTNNNTLALGLTHKTALKTKIYAVYNINPINNNNPADDRAVALTTHVKDCACCGAYIAPGVWKEFLCHNLGADTSLDPHDMAQTDAWALQGANIGWGKRGPNITGDSRIDWQTAPNDGPNTFRAAPTASNPNLETIAGWSSTPVTNGDAWGDTTGAKTAIDPCPTGYRVPSIIDWQGVINNNTYSATGSWVKGSYDSAGHFGPNAGTKLLTLPSSGKVTFLGEVATPGNTGVYWSRTSTNNPPPNIGAYALIIGKTTKLADNTLGLNNLQALSIRCIAE